jgi:hypothetical protein
MTIAQIAEAIFDKVFEDIIPITPAANSQADMLAKIFRHWQVERIKSVLEKSNSTV